MKWQEGLVIGKFRPPHKGHSLLINTALEQCEHLTIILCENTVSDKIPAYIRNYWLTDLFPTATIKIVDVTECDSEEPEYWAKTTREWLGFTPDVVFTSENYGEPWAKALGCDHVLVDLDRAKIPISASKFMSDPTKYLDFLEPVVRKYFWY